jgi:hypothetical protein
MEYIARATATILIETTPVSLGGQTLGFYELNPDLTDIASAMESKHGSKPEIIYTPQIHLENSFLSATEPLDKFVAAINRKWGKESIGVGPNLWAGTVVGYNKKTINDFV